MTENMNPWINMQTLSRRRINPESTYNLFWIVDADGKYGFYIEAENALITEKEKINLKGISVSRTLSETNQLRLILILSKKEDWQIFLALCEDLLSVARRYDDAAKMISAVEVRLKRWQQLLKREMTELFPVEKQMGLFSELLCLKDVAAPKYGAKQAVTSWVGPEFDKQDFLMDDAVIEVKSYRTSKGDTVQISSLEQLKSEKEPFYLMSYALTNSNNGLSVEDLSKEIKELLHPEPEDFLLLFEEKLMDYGYFPEMHKEQLHKFIADKQRTFEVRENFPRIIPEDVTKPIAAVKYSINLSECQEFEVDPKSFLKEGDYI